MTERIWLSSPNMGPNELKYVQEAFDTNWISPLGPHVNQFEKDLNLYNGGQGHVAVLNSGTSGIHLALILSGVQPNDHVLCSTFTFVASANPIRYTGAHPVFVDSETDTWNICPIALERSILDLASQGIKPKALILVHLYGMPSKLDEILEICQKYEVPLIEDAAEGLGSKYHGKHLGTLGDFGVFSFNGNKIITTSGGGALYSQNEAAIQKSRFLATQARDQAPHYEHTEMGFNYRMSNVLAGIGRGQLEVLDQRIIQKRAIYSQYLADLGGLMEFIPEPKGFLSNRWLSTVLLPSYQHREQVRVHLETLNIESRPLWKPMHLQPLYAQDLAYLNGVSDDLFQRGLCLPSDTNMTENQQQLVISEIKNAL